MGNVGEEELMKVLELARVDLINFGNGDYGFCKKFGTDSSRSSSPSVSTAVKSPKRSASKELESCCNGTNKKQKKETSASIGTIKVRKDRLGDRIATLQQLVSPFSKSDTASVLHEVLGYIHFLHDQVQVLSSPYLQRMPKDTTGLQDGSRSKDQPSEGELSRRGLRLVHISCIEEATNDVNDDALLGFPTIQSNFCSK